MKAFRNTISVLLAVILVLLTPISAFADEEDPAPSGFPASDGETMYNSLNSGQMPTFAQPSDVYGVVDTSEAEEIDSMFSDEARAEFSAALDRISAFTPVEDSEVSLVLGRVENFLTSGGLGNYLQSGSTLLGAEIGLTQNKPEKVRVLGTDANTSSWVFVVDKDAMSFWVRDEEGMGIPDALVTISYLNEEGQRVTTSVTATDGNTPGIAVFDDIPEAFYGIVDIQADGYRAVSILDKSMAKGDHYTQVLTESHPDELYIRGVDLSGKDMVNEETGLNLVDMDTEDLTLKVIVTKTGSAELPASIDIYSENRGQTVLTVSQTSDYPYDSNTRVYIATKRWVEQSAGLFKDQDMVSIRFGGETFGMEHVTVENAVTKPGVGETNVPIQTKPQKGDVSDRLGGAGWLSVTFQALQVPVTFGVYPDGCMIFMASYDITKLDPNTQYKFSSLFEKSWNPRSYKELSDPLQVFERSFWENAEKVKGGKEVLNSKKKIKAVANKNYDFQLSFSLFLCSNYNKKTDDTYGTGGIIFCGGLTAGVTEYFLIPAGPVIIPLYIGFEGNLSLNVSLSVNFCIDKPPVDQQQDYKWKYANNDSWDVNARIEIIAGLSVFGGVGVRGVLGAGATGFVSFDIATLLGKGQASLLDRDPHSFIDFFYGLKINYYLLFYSGEVKIQPASGAVRLSDSWGEYDSALEAALSEMTFTELDLSAVSDDLVPVLEDSGGDHDKAYTLAGGDPALESSSTTVTVDGSTYPDNQAQFVATQNHTALFRILSIGNKSCLMYQFQNKTDGKISPTFYLVELPEGETRSVTEFVVVPNKTDRKDPNNNDKVYIGAVLADNSMPESERIQSTDVAGIVVDLGQIKTTSSLIVSDPKEKGQYLYSAPRPAGREGYLSVAYAATYLRQDNGETVSDLKTLLGVTPGSTDYRISWCEPQTPAERHFVTLNASKVHSTGAIAPNEPTYWAADMIRSSDKYLVLNGFGANGYYEETLRCNVRVDIDGLLDPEDVAAGRVNYDTLVTNWQYLEGCNYFIMGDSVYWMDKKAKASTSDYEWAVEKVENGSGVVSVEGRYAMIVNNNQSAIHIIGVVDDYDVDVEGGTSAKSFNKATKLNCTSI